MSIIIRSGFDVSTTGSYCWHCGLGAMMASSTYTIRIAIRWWVHPVLSIALALGRIGLSGAAVSLCALVARRGWEAQ